MLLRRLEVFFIVLFMVTAVYHIMKRMDVIKCLEKPSNEILQEIKPHLPPLRTPILLGFGPIRQEDRGVYRSQGGGRRGSRGRRMEQ